MVGKETVLVCSDNSGIVYARCINVSSTVNLHDFVLSSVITVMPKILDFSKPLRKKKFLGLIISLKKITRRPQGIWIRFESNRLLLLNDSFKFMGTRVYGPVCREIKKSKKEKALYKKIISYSKIAI
ncbi:ribosomal protein L14 (mitochondrion) [Paulinella micropora]|uniref:Ribosomal protein L14 n=1 Tax=Paulinella micropora TaxID=1928728 RepID=A0A5K7W5T7_9EUKA|nr:ribosomal protein L14 [Paulinella micropora]BBL86688.1 ribosomal protein L14 [Paulinella micropora]